MTWSKVKPIHLGPHTTAQEELTAAVNNFLNDYGSRKACMLGRFHAERVRQMRVAVRRPRVLPVSI